MNLTQELNGSNLFTQPNATSVYDNSFQRFLIVAFACSIIVGTIVGNTFVIVAVVTSRTLRKVGNVFIINLAVADILVGIFVTPIALVFYFMQTWPFGSMACVIWISLDIVCCTASIVSLCVISYDRFSAITSPLKYTNKRTYKRAGVIVTITWIYSLIIAVPPLVGMRSHSVDENDCQITTEEGYTVFSTCGAFYLPLSMIMFSYSRIFCTTVKNRKHWAPGPGTSKRMRTDKESTFISSDSKSSVSKLNIFGKRDEKPSEFTGEHVVKNVFQQTSKLIIVTPCIDIEKNQMMKNMFISLAEQTKNKEGDLQRAAYNRKILLRQVSNFNSDSSGSTSTVASSDTTMTDIEIPTIIEHDASGSDTDVTSIQSSPSPLLRKSVRVRYGATDEPRRGILVTPNEPPRRLSPSADDKTVSFKQRLSVDQPKNQQRRRSSSKRRILISQEKRAARTLAVVVGGFVVCWLPFFLVTLIRPLCSSCEIHPVIIDFVLWLGYCNSALNPVIYTFFNRDFRKAFKNILTNNACRRRPSSSPV